MNYDRWCRVAVADVFACLPAPPPAAAERRERVGRFAIEICIKRILNAFIMCMLRYHCRTMWCRIVRRQYPGRNCTVVDELERRAFGYTPKS